MTVRDALRLGAESLALREDLRDHAARDAQQLLEIATGLGRVRMLASPEQVLSETEIAGFELLLQRRGQAVPIQYLRGSQEFYGRSFRVTPAVLIPRPETELLIDAALEILPDRQRVLNFADVGTGSGVLALTLALEYPRSSVLALDLSAEALAVAEQNADALGLKGRHRVRFLQSDLLAATAGSAFDLIVSNPPYVPLVNLPTLHPQVRDHEPHLALFGGDDGHDVLRRLVPQAHEHLIAGGWLMLETAGRSAMLDCLLEGWSEVRFVRDLQGIERVAVARRR